MESTLIRFRTYLAECWEIWPYGDGEKVAHRLSVEDAKTFTKASRRLGDPSRELEKQFYDWIATPERLGPIHSIKWVDILASGFASYTWLLKNYRNARILDLGCHAGYWPGWMHGEGFDIHGVDGSAPAIQLGMEIMADCGGMPPLHASDYRMFTPEKKYDVVVSHQGLGRSLGDGKILRHISSWLRDGGILLSIDRQIASIAAMENAFRQADLGIEAAGLVEAFSGKEKSSYPALILRKGITSRTTMDVVYTRVREVWGEHFKPYVDSLGYDDWTLLNTAYMTAAGIDTWVTFD